MIWRSEKYSWSVRIRLLAREAYRFSGELELAEEQEEAISKLVEASPWRYSDSENLVALGRLSLEYGFDAGEVQKTFFERARRNSPRNPKPLMAMGELALDKRDFALAAELFREGIEKFPESADMPYGLAMAMLPSSPAEAEDGFRAALRLNSSHLPTLLALADRAIDGERYDAAEESIEAILAVNPDHPLAWTYRAVIAHLKNDVEGEEAARERALSRWPTNPGVEHLYGLKLSQKYRFSQGAAAQRRALEFDDEYRPARRQLATDLLRLGDEQSGWELAEQVHTADPYDVNMFNLMELKDELDSFVTLERAPFVVRMLPVEAQVYGDRVLDLLEAAQADVGTRYGFEPE